MPENIIMKETLEGQYLVILSSQGLFSPNKKCFTEDTCLRISVGGGMGNRSENIRRNSL